MSEIEYTKVGTLDAPLKWGQFSLNVYKIVKSPDPETKFVLVFQKERADKSKAPLVRMHSSCLFGDTFGYKGCDCNQQLNAAMQLIAKEGGILFYLDQEGRSHGLFNKVNELELIAKGYDTVEASEALNLIPDQRDYSIIGELLKSMDINEIRLISNNPLKKNALTKAGIQVELESLPVFENDHNTKYLHTKMEKMGHNINLCQEEYSIQNQKCS